MKTTLKAEIRRQKADLFRRYSGAMALEPAMKLHATRKLKKVLQIPFNWQRVVKQIFVYMFTRNNLRRAKMKKRIFAYYVATVLSEWRDTVGLSQTYNPTRRKNS